MKVVLLLKQKTVPLFSFYHFIFDVFSLPTYLWVLSLLCLSWHYDSRLPKEVEYAYLNFNGARVVDAGQKKLRFLASNLP